MIRKNFSRALSVFLAVVMIAVAMPVAFAAEPITLSKSNVVTWPTVNGTCYYGQKIGDALTLEGGEVQYNGATVPGEFVFTNPDKIDASAGSGVRADLTFKPSNSSEYAEFSVSRSRDVKYAVSYGKLTLADASNPPVVIDEVEVGTTLSTITISGGQVINAHNALEEGALNAVWEWVTPSTIVHESGTFEATISAANYETFTFPVQINVKSSVIVPTIETLPIFNDIEYTPKAKYSDYELIGGRAVDIESGTEIEGVFSYADEWVNFEPHPNHTEIDIIFTPNDIETYSTVKFKIPVKIKLRQIAFVDNEGNVVEDFIFEVEPGTKMYDVVALVRANLRTPENAVISVEDSYSYAENGRKYKLTVNHDDSNYTGTELYFTIAFKETEITPTLKWVGEGKLKVDCGEYAPLGKFAVYCVVGETETKIGDVKGNSEILEWTPAASGIYNFKVVYNPAENDYFKIDNVITTPYSYFPKHNVIATGTTPTGYAMGETVAVTAPATDPSMLDKPYYGFTGWTDVKDNTGLSGDDLANAAVTFTMPDEDVELKANYKFSLKLFFEWIWAQIVQFFNFVINAVKDLVALI